MYWLFRNAKKVQFRLGIVWNHSYIIFFHSNICYVLYSFIIYISEKKFSFLSEDELAKMKEEEERRIALMTRREFEQIASAASKEALSWTDATLEDVEAIDKMARGQPAPKRSLDSSNLQTKYVLISRIFFL